MTITARLPPPPNACLDVGLPYGGWSTSVTCCPYCRHQIRVPVAPCPCKYTTQSMQTPSLTSPCTVQPNYLPHSPVYGPQLSSIISANCKEELKRLRETLRVLCLSGWYYGTLDWQGARTLLKDASEGAFVVRDSGDSKFIFSLSIQTERGPTSARLHYEQGFFRLDCEAPLARYMPRFRCVVELVQHYIRHGERKIEGTVWVDRDGCPHSRVLLKKPLRKSPPSLLHAARLAVHKALACNNPLTPKLWCAPKHRLLPLPSSLIEYLGEYPYTI